MQAIEVGAAHGDGVAGPNETGGKEEGMASSASFRWRHP